MKHQAALLTPLFLLLAASCSNEEMLSSSSDVTFYLSAMGVNQQALTRAGIAEPTHVLVLDCYDSKVSAHTQSSLEEIALPLEYGEHTLYFVAATNAWTSYNTSDLTISWDGERFALSTVWAYKCDLTVSAETHSQEIMLPLVVANVIFETLDKAPANLGNLSIEAPDVCRGLDLKTMKGFLTENPYSYTIDISSFANKAIGFSLYTFIPAATGDATASSIGDIVVTAYTKDDPAQELSTKTLDAVPVTAGYKTLYSGYFFSDGISIPLSYMDEWLGTEKHGF